MLILLRQNAQNPTSVVRATIALRDQLAGPDGGVVAIDAATLTSATNGTLTPDFDEQVLAVAEPVIDLHHARGVRRFVVSVPVGAEGRLPRLALLLTRQHNPRCFAVAAPEADDASLIPWARDIAARVRANAPALRTEPLRPSRPRLTTPRLSLGDATDAQCEGYYNAIRGTWIFDNLIWDGPRSAADILDFQWRGLQELARGPQGSLNWPIIESTSGLFIGACGFKVLQRDPGRLEIGYTLASAFHGRGYATEAVGAMMSWIFEHRAPDRVQAHVYVGNDASKRVLEKVGFVYEGLIRANTPKRGVRKDEWLYAITRNEWRERTNAT